MVSLLILYRQIHSELTNLMNFMASGAIYEKTLEVFATKRKTKDQ